MGVLRATSARIERGGYASAEQAVDDITNRLEAVIARLPVEAVDDAGTMTALDDFDEEEPTRPLPPETIAQAQRTGDRARTTHGPGYEALSIDPEEYQHLVSLAPETAPPIEHEIIKAWGATMEPERCPGNCSRGGDGPACGRPGCTDAGRR